MSWPSHRAQPFGAKLPVKMRISARNGLDIIVYCCPEPGGLVLRGEDALQRDDEIQHEVRRHVLVRLAAAGGAEVRRVHARVGGSGVGLRVGVCREVWW